jgi:hypothetical protein
VPACEVVSEISGDLLGLPVLVPPSEANAEIVDLQTERERAVVDEPSRDRRLADPCRPVEMDEGGDAGL